MSDFFPPFIRALPEPDLPVAGAKARLFEGKRGQAVFFTLPKGVVIPPHSHGAQWGVVVAGTLELCIAGQWGNYRKGDSYSIPAGAVHEARCPEEVVAVDFFADADRYKVKGG